MHKQEPQSTTEGADEGSHATNPSTPPSFQPTESEKARADALASDAKVDASEGLKPVPPKLFTSNRNEVPATIPDRFSAYLMLLTTFTTGIIDAIGWLGYDRVFAANMTGNILVLGMGLSGKTDLPVLGPALALLAFTIGCWVTGLLLHDVIKGYSIYVFRMYAVEAAVLLAMSVVMYFYSAHTHDILRFVYLMITSLAMGMQATAARRVAVPDVTTVVVTSTLTALVSENPKLKREQENRHDTARRFLAIFMLVFGAVVGALLHARDPIHGDAVGIFVTSLNLVLLAWLGFYFLKRHPVYRIRGSQGAVSSVGGQ